MTRQRVYLVLCVAGSVLPWWHFLQFFVAHGIDLSLFVDQSFANRVASGAAWDLIVSSVVLWVLVLTEGRRLGVPHLWAPLVSNIAVGVSLGLPLFLYLRQRHLDSSLRRGDESTVRRVSPEQRVVGDPTEGIVREQAFAKDDLWAGVARTSAGVTSAWHHHGDNDTAVYVESGVFRVEFGPDGRDVVESHPGDFVFVPRAVVHRESNPSDKESRLVIVRAGSGPPTVNVEGPA